jgi:hypothetical protein
LAVAKSLHQPGCLAWHDDFGLTGRAIRFAASVPQPFHEKFYAVAGL